MKNIFITIIALTLLFVAMAGNAATQISLVTDPHPGAPARHGLAKLRAALGKNLVSTPGGEPASTTIVAGLAQGSGEAARLIRELKLTPPSAAEALLIRRLTQQGRKILLIAGADDRGLMYALLDAADRAGWASAGEDPLACIRESAEQPQIAERGVTKYAFQRALFEAQLFNEDYWEKYFDLLAENRFNNFALIFGYENGGFLAPPYPYFFDVEGFPGVRVVPRKGETAEQVAQLQQRYSRALHRVVAIAHEHGIRFTVGIWDHILHKTNLEGYVDPSLTEPDPGLVWGLTHTNLFAYNKAAMAKFIDTFPEIDNYNFRTNTESGLTKDEILPFWNAMLPMWMQHAPEKRFVLRAKGTPDELVDLLLKMKVKMRMDTKIWYEQMGLPYHPTHIQKANQLDRRTSYADMLRYPRRYAMQWSLWNGGTARILQWGDPEYARRFMAAAHVYGGDNFMIAEPLATQMHASPAAMPLVNALNKPYQYTQYEFQRYWPLLQVFGRIGYNPATPDEVWDRQFARRYGAAAPSIEKALHTASWIMPMINANTLIGIPTTKNWPEKQCGFGLAEYSELEPSDTQQVASYAEEARLMIEGGETAKSLHEKAQRWFEQTASDVLKEADQAERAAGTARGKELTATLTDLRILAALARYHARRIPAGINYQLFAQSQDLNALDRAIDAEKVAIEAWKGIVAAAGDVYADNLRFGRMGGHWRDELKILEADLVDLEHQRQSFRPELTSGSRFMVSHAPLRKQRVGERALIAATVDGKSSTAQVRLIFGPADGPYKTITMRSAGNLRYRAEIPASLTQVDYLYAIEAADVNGRKATWPAGGISKPYRVTVTNDETAPRVDHTPVTKDSPGKPLTITARASDESGVKWVHLRYRAMNQMLDYKTLPMTPTGRKDEYQAKIPAAEIDPKFDFQYLIEAMDKKGNGKIYPAVEKGTPYVIVHLE